MADTQTVKVREREREREGGREKGGGRKEREQEQERERERWGNLHYSRRVKDGIIVKLLQQFKMVFKDIRNQFNFVSPIFDHS